MRLFFSAAGFLNKRPALLHISAGAVIRLVVLTANNKKVRVPSNRESIRILPGIQRWKRKGGKRVYPYVAAGFYPSPVRQFNWTKCFHTSIAKNVYEIRYFEKQHILSFFILNRSFALLFLNYQALFTPSPFLPAQSLFHPILCFQNRFSKVFIFHSSLYLIFS